MKRVLPIAAALLALTSVADAGDRYYSFGGGIVRMMEFEDGEVELRLVPGWQLDPKCRQSELADACDAAGGMVLFSGRWSDGSLTGEASLYRDGCGDFDDGFAATIRHAGRGRLMLMPIAGPAKCAAVLKPARAPR